jgi:hypothetical protein
MSYDINIYQGAFLRRALSENLGDWTGAPDIDNGTRVRFGEALRAQGFRETPHEPKFLTFAAAKGFSVSHDFVRDDDEILATASVFSNSLTFSIPMSPRSGKSIEQCLNITRELVAFGELCSYDPQTGELSN